MDESVTAPATAVLARSAIVAIAAIAIISAGCTVEADCAGDDCVRRSVEVSVDASRVLRSDSLEALFSFNLNHFRFERDLLGPDGSVDPGPVSALAELPAVFYRYPGGLVANSFYWESAVGPMAGREPQASVDHAPAAPVRFGIDEYFRFVEETGGRPWYVLNLLGWSSTEPDHELPADTVADANHGLAAYIREHHGQQRPMYFQLGNELDRAEYQWPVDKYVARSRESMAAIRKELPEARFVAFLRDFDWTYKGKGDARAGTKSRFREFIPAVLDGLPEVEDFSLHFYYDDPGLDRRAKRVGWRLNQIRTAIDVARSARGGDAPNVWITEHARGINLEAGKGMQRAALTSNLSAAVSTADFLIGLAQIPEVKGAFWHGINAGPWQLFDASIEHKDLRPRPVYWGYRVLSSVLLPQTLATDTSQQPHAAYADGYDLRTVAFRSTDGEVFGLWVANRRNEPARLAVRYAPFAGEDVVLRQFEMYGAAGADANDPAIETVVELAPEPASAQVAGDGRLELTVQASSVTAVEIRRQ